MTRHGSHLRCVVAPLYCIGHRHPHVPVIPRQTRPRLAVNHRRSHTSSPIWPTRGIGAVAGLAGKTAVATVLEQPVVNTTRSVTLTTRNSSDPHRAIGCHTPRVRSSRTFVRQAASETLHESRQSASECSMRQSGRCHGATQVQHTTGPERRPAHRANPQAEI